jgi:seryl-tRNA synthetase
MDKDDDMPREAAPMVRDAKVDERALSELLTELRFLAQENGRLRAERDVVRAERDRLANWIETDRELTKRMLTALETELRSLRSELERLRNPKTQRDESAPLAENDPGPSLRTEIGRRIRERSGESG